MDRHPNELCPPAYDHIVSIYNLTLLQSTADFSIEDGDLALTKDGDIKLGDTAYNGLFRLVQAWRYSEPHLRYLFATMKGLLDRRAQLDKKLNETAEERGTKLARGNARAFGPEYLDYAAALNAIWDEQGVVVAGAATYAGCLILLLSGMLLRFNDDNLLGRSTVRRCATLLGEHDQTAEALCQLSVRQFAVE